MQTCIPWLNQDFRPAIVEEDMDGARGRCCKTVSSSWLRPKVGTLGGIVLGQKRAMDGTSLYSRT